MAVEGAVTPGASVPQGQVGSGLAQVLKGKADPLGRFYRAKNAEAPDAAALAAKKKAENQAWDDMLDFAPDEAWSVLEQPIADSVTEYRDWLTNAHAQGIDPNNMSFKAEAKDRQQAINLMSRYTMEMKTSYMNERGVAKENKDKYDWDKYITQLNDAVFYHDEKGVKRLRDPFSVKKDMFATAGTNADNYNHTKVWSDAIENFEEITDAYISRTAKNGLTRQQETEFKGRLMEYKDGQLVLRNGMPVIDLNDEAKEVFLQESWVNDIVTQGRAKGMKEEDIWKVPMEILQRGIGRKEGKVTESYAPEHYMDRVNPDVDITTTDSVPRKHTYEDDDGNTKDLDMHMFRGHTIGGKAAEKEHMVQSTWYIDTETGKVESGWVGNKKVYLTEVELIPWNYGEKGKGAAEYKEVPGPGIAPPGADKLSEADKAFRLLDKEQGNIIYGDPQKFTDRRFDNPNIGVRWMVQGTIKGEEKDGSEDQQVLVPYEHVQGKLRDAYNFDLGGRKLSEYHPEELIDLLMTRAKQRGEKPTRAQLQEAVEKIQQDQGGA